MLLSRFLNGSVESVEMTTNKDGFDGRRFCLGRSLGRLFGISRGIVCLGFRAEEAYSLPESCSCNQGKGQRVWLAFVFGNWDNKQHVCRVSWFLTDK